MGTSDEVAWILNEIFLERRPVDELSMDYDTASHPGELEEMHNEGNMNCFFREVYWPSENGIREKHHFMMKDMAEKRHITSFAVVLFYNMLPQLGRLIFRYEWWQTYIVSQLSVEGDCFCTGRRWSLGYAPPNLCCSSQWGKGIVMAVDSQNNVSVDEMLYHVLAVWKITDSLEEEERGEDASKSPLLWKLQWVWWQIWHGCDDRIILQIREHVKWESQ